MIKNSIVAKLLVTIISLFIVVLALLSMFLEQLFDNYFYKAEKDRLEHRIEHMATVMTDYSNPISELIVRELALEEKGEAEIFTGTYSEQTIARLSPADLQQLVAGEPVVERGYSPKWDPAKKADQDSFWALHPLIHNGQIAGLLFVSQPISAVSAVERVRELLFFAAGLGIILASGLAYVVSRNLSNPLIQMNKVAEEMAQRDFHGKVQVVTSDEVGRLGMTLNALAYKLEENIDDLEREKEQLASIITSMTDGVIAADLNGTITLANPPARHYIHSEMRHLSAGGEEIKQLPRDLYDLEMRVMKDRESILEELNWHGRILIVTMVPLYEKDGATLRGVVTVLRDVTDERKLEKMRKDFVANVSHELRTPLAMMQGYSEALLDEFGDDPEQRHELTHIILDETHRMRRLVNDLLDLAQLESGQFQMHKDELDMLQLVRRVGRKFTTVAHDRGITLQAEIDDSPEPLLVYGDGDRLEQVFTNLIDNAFRHTASGGQITLSMNYDQNCVRIAVQDTGEGIPAADLPHIWDRFYKVDKARTRSKGGTGLGLSITLNIVKNHQGDIVVTSEEGQGTQFTVELPRMVS